MLKWLLTEGGDAWESLAGLLQGDEDWAAAPAKDAPLPDGATVLIALDGNEETARTASALGAREQRLYLLLADAIYAREDIQPGYAARVAAHATRFAKALDLAPAKRGAFETGAILCDIGKLRLTNELLLKKQVLSYDEWTALQRHTVHGAELLVEQGFSSELADMVRNHHECWDGTGYPDKREGEAIPRLARAMKILDVYCAMTSPRHYRAGHATHDQAIAHLREERGKHFDPELVDVFIDAKAGVTP